MQSAPLPSAFGRAFKRRSARVPLTIQLSIEVGGDSALDGETITVSKYGARIRITSSRRRLALGERFRVAVGRGQEAQTARVVWLDKRADAHYGIELDDPGNFWGVYFPSKDGEWRFERKAVRRPAAVASTPAAVQPELAAPLAVEEKPAPPPLPEIGRMPARVAGLSTIRLPFAENVELVLTAPQEGTVLLQHMVEPGATLRVTLADNRITKARVVAMSRQREAGKWRVRIICDVSSA